MIQRKQSLWLLLAALINAGVFFFDLFTRHTVVNGVETIEPYRANQHFPLLLIGIVMTALPLVTIFMFGDRKRQVRMCFAAIIAIISFVSKTLMDTKVDPPTTITYAVGAVLPVVALVFVVLAIIAIRKDERLVRSMDRLR
jgi:peptidoglycan/LPS O-acetylase OafA/YrhL